MFDPLGILVTERASFPKRCVSYRCVVGKGIRNGQAVRLVADVGSSGVKDAVETSALPKVATVRVSQSSVDTIILGSAGYW